MPILSQRCDSSLDEFDHDQHSMADQVLDELPRSVHAQMITVCEGHNKSAHAGRADTNALHKLRGEASFGHY